jgi:hypothetical protein
VPVKTFSKTLIQIAHKLLKQALRNEKTDAFSCSKEHCASAAPCTGIASLGRNTGALIKLEKNG